MKIIVMGSGITGLISAVALKKHCPWHEICLIDSVSEPVNFGFGESAPPQMQQLMMQAFKIDNEQWQSWFSDFIVETKSTLKYNIKWQDFLHKDDRGFFSGIGDVPSYQILFETSHSKKYLPDHLVFPDHKEYKITDLWYELYMAGRRKLENFEGDINPFYWHSVHRRWLGHVDATNKVHSFASWPSIHLNSASVAAWLKNKYHDIFDEIIVGTIQDINHDSQGAITGIVLDSGMIISGDLYLDCTGFKRITANKFNHKIKDTGTDIAHDSAVIVANGYSKNIDQEMHPYTSGFAMENGWTFSIPLLDRKSYGYVFDSKFTDSDKAFEELASLSNPKSRVVERIDLHWKPGCYAETWRHNYIMLGLASGFVDAFDANTIGVNFLQIFSLIEILKDNVQNLHQHRSIYNLKIIKHFKLISERIEMHFGLAPKNTSAYWVRNHSIAQQKNLHLSALNVFSHPDHSISSHNKSVGKPFMWHLYFSNTIYYDLDLSSRCRKSSPEILDLADEYFKSYNNLNCKRALVAPTMRQWYYQNNIDLDQYIKF